MTTLPPASQKLLREIAKYDTGNGVLFRYASRGRFSHPNTLSCYNARTFWPLSKAKLIDYENEDAPVRITDAGRQALAELDAQQAEKKTRPKPSANGATALRLLREIAKYDEPPMVYDDGLRRVWRVASRDGHRASIGIWVALEKAGYIRTTRVSNIGGHRVTVTDAGRQRLTAA
ncbi:hypothetical protein [Streptomyces cylindrosporus]|uniref:Uncharacterized protein n=1 Tax=Streptomyces cylindrosporus TaxID=2927583 RepID=A0ABS9YJZ4_9ACTN|nr:hypothetical protein [Streptomyces cylindrosporus]MCI3277577.1 hypothetical protein [Streptomyces cylindrosporus]